MKILKILLTTALAGTLAFGQGTGQSGPRGGASHTPPTPAQIAQRETNRLTRFFTLTTAQASTVLALLTTVDTQIQALASQVKPLQTSFVEAVKANNQSQISSTSLQISNLQEQEHVIRANAAGQIYATVLTSAQQGLVGAGLGPLMGEWSGRGFGGRPLR